MTSGMCSVQEGLQPHSWDAEYTLASGMHSYVHCLFILVLLGNHGGVMNLSVV